MRAAHANQNATSRAARVLWLIDRSFKARQDGDLDAERDALAQASAVDAAPVAEVQAGIARGDVPDIEIDPRGWDRYFLSSQTRDSAQRSMDLDADDQSGTAPWSTRREH